ncbi:MAG TPA: SRPBCC family protein [Methylophilaceae bacterium]|nr:SRPBCC family protein [Methylophilaceae bacterium]
MSDEMVANGMLGMMESKTITLSVAVASATVYEFASNPENLPLWSPSFCQSISQADGEWIAESALGQAAVTFVQTNAFGVLDHIVRLSAALEVYNAMRVIPNGSGSEVMFTLFRTSGMSEVNYADDATHVENDLRTLKHLLETRYNVER